MIDLDGKLQLKGRALHVVNAPAGFDVGVTADAEDASAAVLVFVRNGEDLETFASPALDAARADRLAWIAYPKAGQLDTDLNRDRLWEALQDEGVRPVRQISIDDVWSALRFRPGT